MTLLFVGLIANVLWIAEPAFFGTNGADKMRAIRKGEIVAIDRGRQARLNLKDKTYETSDGKKIYVGDDEDFFPSSESKRLAIELQESFQSNHPIMSEIQKIYKESKFMIWIIIGCFFAVYFSWQLLKFLIRELFFTAAKAIEDAKNKNH